MARNLIPRFIAAYDQAPDLSQLIQILNFLPKSGMLCEAPGCCT